MKQIKRIMIVVLTLVLAVSLSLTAFAATASQDGLELSVTTDKTSYSATEQVTVTITVKNTNAFAVSNVAVESSVPDGYKPANGYSSTKNIATLGAGETATLTVVFVPQNSGPPSGPSYPTYPPYPWYSGNTSNTGDAEETEEVVEIDQPTEGNTSVFEEVTVTAKRNVGLWVLIAVISADALIAVLAGKKRLKKTMSIMLCIAMVGTLATVLPVEVNAAVMPLEAGGIKNLSASTTISVGGRNISISAKTSWVENEEQGIFSVVFESNGGSAVATQRVVSGESAVRPTDPVKEGYTFVAWYKNIELTELYDFASLVTESITLYARWSEVIPEDHSYIDDPDVDIEIYSFDMDARSAPINKATPVTFTAEVFANVILNEEDICIYDSGNTLIGYMNDNGINGDITANDGIYSLKVEIFSNVEKSVNFYVKVKEVVSYSLSFRYYLPMTDEDHDIISAVDNAIHELFTSEDFINASHEKKVELVKELLDSLIEQGLVIDGSVEYDEASKAFTYRYADGVIGIIDLENNDNGYNSSGGVPWFPEPQVSNPYANYGGVYSLNNAENYQTLASHNYTAKALILNAFIIQHQEANNSYRTVFYNDLKQAWDANGLYTTIDTDVTVDDMKHLGRGDYNFIVLSMHGGHAGRKYCLALNEVATAETDEMYWEELRSRGTVARYNLYYSENYYNSYKIIDEQFFADNYSPTSLKGKVIFSESCMFYGCDSQSTTSNYLLAKAFTDISAEAVVGYHNSVRADYSRELMQLVIEDIFDGDSVTEAVNDAIRRRGANDNWSDPSDDKYIAYPVIYGKEDYVMFGDGMVYGAVRDAANNQALPSVLVRVYTKAGFPIKSTRTDINGYYSISLSSGEYVIKFSTGHYASAKVAINVLPNDSQNIEVVLMLEPGLLQGKAHGRITNAIISNQGESGVVIKLRHGWNNTNGVVLNTVGTGEYGEYSIDYDAGLYTMEYSKSGFVTGYKNIIVMPIDLIDQNAIITPLTSEDIYRIVLTWQNVPDDLDSHLVGPTADGGRFHLYYPYADANDGSLWPDYVKLDLDNTRIRERSDPETTTIIHQLEGPYVYSVHDYTNAGSSSSTAMANSNATVTVYKGNTVMATFHVPANSSGTIWTVFELNGDTITPINRFSNGYDDDVGLFDPYLGEDNTSEITTYAYFNYKKAS